MKELILNGYEFLTAMVPLAAVSALLGRIYNNKKTVIRGHVLMVVIFALYLLAVFHLTGAGTIYNWRQYGIQIDPEQVNLLPFSREIDFLGYFENVLLFVPLGFLLPLIWINMNKMKNIFLFGFSFSLLIEMSQLLNNRQTDVDDLLMNTLGALAGYFLFKLFAGVFKWENRLGYYWRYEPIIYVAAMFLGRFLLFDEFGLVKILYGF